MFQARKFFLSPLLPMGMYDSANELANKDGRDLLPLYIDIQLLRKQIIVSGKLKVQSSTQPRVKIKRLDKHQQQQKQATVHKTKTISPFSPTKDEVVPREDVNLDDKKSQLAHSLFDNDCVTSVQDDRAESCTENANWSCDHEHNDDETNKLPITTGLNDETDRNLDSSHCENEITIIKVDYSEVDPSNTEYNYAFAASDFNIPAHDHDNMVPSSPKQLPCSTVTAGATKTNGSSSPVDEAQDEFPVDTPRQPKKSLRSLLKCVTCGKTFTTQSSLDSHIETHDQVNEDSSDNSGLEDCNDDNDPINSDNDFEVRDDSESNNIDDDRRTRDENAEDSMNTEKRKRTSVDKNNRKLKCDVCGRGYSHGSSLSKHKTQYRKLGTSCKTKLVRKKKEKFPCDVCGEVFFDSDGLHSHQQTEGVHATLPIITRSKVPITNPVSCDICGRKFASPNSLIVHKNYHAKSQVEKINRTAALETDGESSAPIEPLPETQCRICKQIFSCRAAVQKHRVVEHNLPFYVDCQNCGKLYSDHVHFYRHRRRQTNADKRCFTNDPELLKPAVNTLFPYKQNPRGNKFCPTEDCYEVFEFDDLLSLHIKTHGKWSCHFCNKEFTKAHEMAWHEIGHSSFGNNEEDKTLKYNCTRCEEKDFTKQGLISHILHIHLKVPSLELIRSQSSEYKCPICTKTLLPLTPRTAAEDIIKEHIEKWHGVEGKDPEQLYNCTVCDAHFINYRFLTSHLKQIHNIAMKRYSFTKPLECHICKGTYQNRGALRRHLQLVHKQQSSGLPGDFSCNICGERYAAQHALIKHIKRIHEKNKDDGEGPFKCEICSRVYPSKERLYLHTKLVHKPPKKVYCCETCGKVYKKSDKLNVHIRFSHMDRSTWKFVCPEEGCGKRLFTKQRLADHIRTHTKEAPFLCYLCGGAFRYRQYLRTHLVKVHGPDAANALPSHTYNKPYDQIVREKQAAAEENAVAGDDATTSSDAGKS
ncbi:unnamed protein product [Orchesella dallaii]|uniref:C2H2-type domain-containing protein n=1 Tax=Orchesella dallaii TaxID=48710 RepID=A0ABP1RZ85_9HEXA